MSLLVFAIIMVKINVNKPLSSSAKCELIKVNTFQHMGAWLDAEDEQDMAYKLDVWQQVCIEVLDNKIKELEYYTTKGSER